MNNNRRMMEFVRTICYLQSAEWLASQFGKNNWTPQQLKDYPDSCGEFWCEDELFDLIAMNNLPYDNAIRWLDDNRDWWEGL